MRTLLPLVLGALSLMACDDKPKPDPASSSSAPQGSAKAASDVSPAVPITAAAAVVAADGSVKRSWSGDHFDVVLSAPACKAKSSCTADIQLVAKPGYHVNEEFPYKFAANPAGGVAYKGKEQPEIFSKAAGDFTKASASEARLQIRYEADGSVKKLPVSGTFKMSVCNEASCQVEAPKLDVEVPLSG